MSTFRTTLTPSPSDYSIAHSAHLLTIGSCFADSMGNTLSENKFNTLANPYGTVYNPISIHGLLQDSLTHTYPSENSYLKNQDSFFNYHFHSSFNSTKPGELASQIKLAIDKTHDFIRKANVIIVTYGTSFVYERTDTNEIVANCHKMPSAQFRKRLLTVQEILDSFKSFHDLLITSTSIKKIILTVSPVRHLKDTLELNSVSKSILRTACHLIRDRFDKVDYFPSYEVMIDDLRDYRFYKEDMIHPSQVAEEYIWEKFSLTYFDQSTLETLKRWQLVRKALMHKPLRPGSNSHKAFLKSTLAQLSELRQLIPVEVEINQLKSRMELMPDSK